MIGTQTPRDAIRRAREYIEGVDRVRAIRVSLSMLLAVVVVTSMVPIVYSEPTQPTKDFFIDTGELIHDFEDTTGWTIDFALTGGNIGVEPTNDSERGFGNPRGEFAWNVTGSGNTDTFTIDDPQFNGTYSNVSIWHRREGGADGLGIRMQDGATIFVNQNILGGTNTGKWYRTRVEMNFSNDSYSYRTVDENECTVAEATGVPFNASADRADVFQIRYNTAEDNFPDNHPLLLVDYLYVNGTDNRECENTITGFVKTTDGNPIEDAVVKLNGTNATGISDEDGFYEIETVPGIYNATASRSGFKSQTLTSIDISSEGDTSSNNNFSLFSSNVLQIETDTSLCHGETTDYTVYELPRDTNERNDITDTATVTSSDDDVLEVNTTSQELEATTNINVNQVVDIRAESDNATVTKEVFVGNQTVDNIDKFENSLDALVGLWGNVGCLGDGSGENAPGGTQLTMLWIFASLSAAIVVTRFSTTFGGIGAFAVVMTMGWFIGGVGEGMIMLTWAFGIFLGLNVATNFQSFKR